MSARFPQESRTLLHSLPRRFDYFVSIRGLLDDVLYFLVVGFCERALSRRPNLLLSRLLSTLLLATLLSQDALGGYGLLPLRWANGIKCLHGEI